MPDVDQEAEDVYKRQASIGSTMTTIELAKKYDFIYAAVGVHPSDIADLNEETFAWLRAVSYTHLDVYKRQR